MLNDSLAPNYLSLFLSITKGYSADKSLSLMNRNPQNEIPTYFILKAKIFKTRFMNFDSYDFDKSFYSFNYRIYKRIHTHDEESAIKEAEKICDVLFVKDKQFILTDKYLLVPSENLGFYQQRFHITKDNYNGTDLKKLCERMRYYAS